MEAVSKNLKSIKSLSRDDSRSEIEKKLKLMREEDSKMVRGIFKFYEAPGGTLKFPFKKYKNDPIEIYEFKDGEVYSVPLAVAKHLNTQTAYAEHELRMNDDGRRSHTIKKKTHRTGFQSLDYLDIQDNSNNLLLVESL